MILLMTLFCLVPFCYCAPEEEIIKAEKAPPRLGDWISMNKNSINVMTMANLLEKSYNKKSESLYWSKFSVKEASVQVTNEINFRLTVIVEPTGCLKEEDLETCTTPSSDEMKGEKCHYFLVKRPPKLQLLVIGKTCEQM